MDLLPNNIARSLFLPLLFISVFLVNIGYNSHIAHSLPDRTENNSNKIQFYGCEIYYFATHCDPSSNRLESYSVGNDSLKEQLKISSLIYPVTGLPTFVDSEKGKALQLQANRLESIEVTNTLAINPKHLSISFWVKANPHYTIFAESEKYGNIISHANHNQTSGWSSDIFTSETNSSVRFNVFNSAGKRFESAAVPLSSYDRFSQVAATFDSSVVKIYKDGVLFGKTNFEGNYVPDPKVLLRIGGGAYCSTCNLASAIVHDLRFYDRALTDNEVKDAFLNSSSSTKVSSTLNHLIGHWKFDGSLTDTSGNNNDGTLYTLVASMVFAPDGRLFFTEKNSGNIRIMKDDKVFAKPFVTISDAYVNWEQGLLGLAIDPEFRKNHFVYLYYTSVDSDTGQPFNRVVRFTDQDNTGTNMVIILDKIPASKGFHSGGALAFGPNGKLYITVGDGTQGMPAQDPEV